MLPLFTALFAYPTAALSSSQEQQQSSRRQNARPDNPPLDEPLLAVQIGGIVGAYVIFVAITFTLLFVVGRRLRRTVQSSSYTLQVEMMKPKATTSVPNTTDPSPVTPTNKSHGFRSWTSLTKGPQSRISNNGSVGTIDHESVVAADRRRAQEEMEMLYAAVMEYDEQRSTTAVSPVSPTEGVNLKDLPPRSPLSFKSTQSNPFSDSGFQIPESQYPQPYPQQYQPPNPAATTQQQQPQPPTSPRSTTSRLSRISNLSLFHSNNSTSNTQTTNKIRSPCFPIRKLPISSPMASPNPSSPTSDQIPLSPRLYNPPPPPAPPIPRLTTTPSSGRIRNPAPAPLNLQSTSGAGHSSSSLPFREAYPQLLSAPPTKTTILERPEKQLNGPRTGLPTPYSPYMPFTPLTPLTPSRIVTKKQRKREVRENGLKALNEEDAVRNDGDMWGY